MASRVFRYVPFLALIAASCVSTGSGGLVDPEKEAGLTVELDYEEPKWNSPPKLEIRVEKGELLGYYSRDENADGDLDGLAIYDTSAQLLYSAVAFIREDGREILISLPGDKDASVRAPYSPSLPSAGTVEYSGAAYHLEYAYARKGGADGYRLEQWIISASGIPMIIYETKVNKGRDPRTEVFTSPAYMDNSKEFLLWAGLNILFRELDSADRYRESQEKAAEFLMDKARDDARENSGFSFGFN